MKQKRFFSFLLLISFVFAFAMTGCGLFSKSKCDRCPEFTEYQNENPETNPDNKDAEVSAYSDSSKKSN